MPSAEIDGAGKVYVAWEDCRFRPKCSSNDIVFSSSSDGVNWSAVTRVPIDPVTSGCALSAGFISSTDGGAHWSAPTQLVGPMSLGEIANTSQGPMVGDYISTSFNQSGAASALSAVGLVPKPPAAFDEAMFAPAAPLKVATGRRAVNAASSAGVLSTGGPGTGLLLQSIRNN